MILALTSASSGAGQQPPAQPVFTSGVTQVEVYATVTDRQGRPVKGLTARDFVVLDNDEPREITTFAAGDFPAAVALAIDRSFSMRGTPLTMARTAGRVFVGSLQPADRVMIISISGEVDVLAPLDANRDAALAALGALEPWSTTALHDALIRSLDLLEGETGRQAIVVLSDGVDRYSTATASDVLDRARRSDVLMYPIAIGGKRPPLFAELAALTGGRSFHLEEPRDLQATLQTIADDLRSQYLLGYQPPPPAQAAGEGEWRSITVRVNRPDVVVRARSGYSTR